MIFVNKEQVSEDSFVSLLETTKTNIKTEFTTNGIPKGINGTAFEDVVYNKMVGASADTDFNGYIEQTGAHGFPDIIARKLYGVEVKMTVGDKWVSTGNSVLESTRIPDVETIYMFFGKFGNQFDAKYRKYQDCLYDVGVTHSPRYKIDMDLPVGNSIFDKLGVSYDVFRKEDSPIKRLKTYYKGLLKEGEELWWIDSTTEEAAVSPIIQPFRLLDAQIKERFVNECMILFPEIFGNSSTKYERPAAYLITGYNSVSASLRDNFTAGGQVRMNIGGKVIIASRLLYNLHERSKDLRQLLYTIPVSKLAYYWNMEISKDPLVIWHDLLAQYSDEAIAIFNEGLKNGED